MRQTISVLACLAALSACSKSNEAVEQKDAQPSAAQTAVADSTPSADDAKTAAFISAVKLDFASQFVASASEACASVKGQEPPDPKSGSPMQYTASGVISWGKGSLDYVKEPGATLSLTSSRSEKTFAFGVNVYAMAKGDRKYVAGLSQLKGASLGATVTDETQAVNGDAKLTTGNLCVGNAAPALATQGMWLLAAKHLQVPATPMSCMPIGKPEAQPLSFAFDGKTIQAGTHSFSQADGAAEEALTIDPNAGTAAVVYSITKADGTGVGLGLSQARVLTYAAVNLPGGVHLVCAPQ